MLTSQVIPTLFQRFGQIIHPRVELHMSIGLWCVLPNKGSEPLSVLQRGIEFNNPSSDFIQDFPVKLVFIRCVPNDIVIEEDRMFKCGKVR